MDKRASFQELVTIQALDINQILDRECIIVAVWMSWTTLLWGKKRVDLVRRYPGYSEVNFFLSGERILLGEAVPMRCKALRGKK